MGGKKHQTSSNTINKPCRVSENFYFPSETFAGCSSSGVQDETRRSAASNCPTSFLWQLQTWILYSWHLVAISSQGVLKGRRRVKMYSPIHTLNPHADPYPDPYPDPYQNAGTAGRSIAELWRKPTTVPWFSRHGSDACSQWGPANDASPLVRTSTNSGICGSLRANAGGGIDALCVDVSICQFQCACVK